MKESPANDSAALAMGQLNLRECADAHRFCWYRAAGIGAYLALLRFNANN